MLYEGLNAYQTFKERLMTTIKLENFIDFFDRDGNCCSRGIGYNRSLSGYYEGQWRLLDTSPGLQAFLSSQQHSSNHSQYKPSSFERTQWYTDYIGHDKLSEDYKKWQLGKLGQDFVNRGYEKGKANFAIVFDDVIQDNTISNQQIENRLIRSANIQL